LKSGELKTLFGAAPLPHLVQQSIADHEIERSNPAASYNALREYGKRTTTFLGFGQQR
jgi:hypothetical protein